MRIATPYKRPVSGIYYFRCAVPNACRHLLNRAIIKESLHTRDPNKARRLFAIKQGDCEKLFKIAHKHLVGDTKVIKNAVGIEREIKTKAKAMTHILQGY